MLTFGAGHIPTGAGEIIPDMGSKQHGRLSRERCPCQGTVSGHIATSLWKERWSSLPLKEETAPIFSGEQLGASNLPEGAMDKAFTSHQLLEGDNLKIAHRFREGRPRCSAPVACRRLDF